MICKDVRSRIGGKLAPPASLVLCLFIAGQISLTYDRARKSMITHEGGDKQLLAENRSSDNRSDQGPEVRQQKRTGGPGYKARIQRRKIFWSKYWYLPLKNFFALIHYIQSYFGSIQRFIEYYMS